MFMNIQKKSVALADDDINIISNLARKKGLNFSSALRMIIREWFEERAPEQARITELGREALRRSNGG